MTFKHEDIREDGRRTFKNRTSHIPGVFVCFVCGRVSRSNDYQIHHIDGDKENNSLSNLCRVCVSCHGRIHTGTGAIGIHELERLADEVQKERKRERERKNCFCDDENCSGCGPGATYIWEDATQSPTQPSDGVLGE